jgi:hypothetical protein
MFVALIEKSAKGTSLSLYDDDNNLGLIESESFADLYTLNFHLQTLAKKHGIEKGLLVVHDKDDNRVSLSLARDENSFFVS